MTTPVGESTEKALKLDFDRRLMLRFRDGVITSDAGLLAYHQLDAFESMRMARDVLADPLTAKNTRHARVVRLPHSVFGRHSLAPKM